MPCAQQSDGMLGAIDRKTLFASLGDGVLLGSTKISGTIPKELAELELGSLSPRLSRLLDAIDGRA